MYKTSISFSRYCSRHNASLFIYSGIKVIIDFVPNHTSNESIWFEKSRSAKDKSDPYWDFYIWNNGSIDENGTSVPPNNWVSSYSSKQNMYVNWLIVYYSLPENKI